VNHATATPFVYSRVDADPNFGQQDRQGYSSYGQNYVYSHYPYSYYNYPARSAYSAYVPAVSTHGYGNVNHATATPFVYSRVDADPNFGQQDRQGYSSYGQNYVYSHYPFSHYPYSHYPARSAYSAHVPAVSTHGYGNVNHAIATPLVYRRDDADPKYGEQMAREGHSYYPIYRPVAAYYYWLTPYYAIFSICIILY